MKKKLLSCFLAGTMVLSLCACGKAKEGAESISVNETETEAEAKTEVETTDGERKTNGWIESDIEENVRNNRDVDLKDDYALAMNAEWCLANPLKDGRMRNTFLGSFEEELTARLTAIVTDDSYENNHDAELVTKYYNAFLDWETRDAAGVEPLMPYLEDITSINSMEDFWAYSTKTEITFADAYSWGISTNPDDSTQKNIYVSAPIPFLLDYADYQHLDELDDYSQLYYDCEKQMVSAVLTKCGYTEDEIDEIFAGAIAFEALYAQYCYTNDDLYLTETTDILNQQIYTYDEFSQLEGVDTYLQSWANWGITDIPQIQIFEKMDYIAHLNDIYSEENLEIIKDYLIAHTAADTISALDKELFYFSLDILNELNGSSGYEAEEKYAMDSVSSSLGWPLSKLYCEKYVTPEDKENVYNVINDIIEEYKLMISEEDFLSEETKENAIRKLEGMVINCMYPDTWYDYSELELDGNLLDMELAINQFATEKSFREFKDPVDREQWDFTPITINAFYYSRNNSINILPGLIGDVLYNDDMEKEEVYAMLGSVVGHEISHGFDPNGAMYDVEGNYTDWWTAEDHEAFEALTAKLVNYYNNIVVWDGFNCNGELVKGEACADMAGVACVLRIAAKDPTFDYDLFFRSYAQLWATNSAENYEHYLGQYDSHPLAYLRINVVVAQFEEFYETYGIKEGDGMYIAPEERVAIW